MRRMPNILFMLIDDIGWRDSVHARIPEPNPEWNGLD